MRSWGSLLPYFLYMARDYENEAMGKFLLPSQPDKGNFTSRMAYETMLKAYQCDHTCVMEVCEWWKQSGPGNVITLRRRRQRLGCPSSIASNVVPKVSLSVALRLHAHDFVYVLGVCAIQ